MIAALLVAIAGLVAACGNDQQDADEPKGDYNVEIVSAKFPGRQYLAQRSKLQIAVKNVDDRTIPNLAVTVDGFDKRLNDPNLADPERPIWIIDVPPENSTTAFTNTWAVGEVEPGQTKVLVWHVTAVMAGTYTLRYQVAGGLHGKAKAQEADGQPAKGSLLARITSRPRPVPDPID